MPGRNSLRPSVLRGQSPGSACRPGGPVGLIALLRRSLVDFRAQAVGEGACCSPRSRRISPSVLRPRQSPTVAPLPDSFPRPWNRCIEVFQDQFAMADPGGGPVQGGQPQDIVVTATTLIPNTMSARPFPEWSLSGLSALSGLGYSPGESDSAPPAPIKLDMYPSQEYT